MHRTIPWLAALMCAGGFSSAAFAWHPFAGLRHGNCTTCSLDTSVPPAAPVTNGESVASDSGCRAGVFSGHALGVGSHVTAGIEGVKQWLLNVPQKTPPPPKPLPINPYTRSPRDFFMVGDP